MEMPFSREEFLNVFGQYNSDVWPIQVAFYVLAIIVLIVLFLNHSRKDIIINLVLSFFWLWMGIVYHMIYFSEINPLAPAFGALFVIQALIFGYFGIVRSRLQYRPDKTAYRVVGIILMLYGLVIYPITSFSFGHVYPKVPTFGLPCPTTIFTFGILLLSAFRLSWYIYLILLLWSVIGVSAAIELSIKEDFALGLTGVIAVAVFVGRGQSRSEAPLTEGQ